MNSRAAQYQQLKKDASYTNVQFDARDGGLRATHVLHHFDAKKGYYEEEAVRVLFNRGHKVILGSEIAADGIKTPDGHLNDKVFDIKGVEGTGHNTIKRKLNEALSQGCEHVVLYYPDALRYSAAAVARGYAQYLGVVRTERKRDTLNHIWITLGEDVIVFK